MSGAFRFGRGTWALGCALLLGGCPGAGSDVDDFRAEVGVFFGGQVQQLERVEYSELAPPKLGFRLFVPSTSSTEPRDLRVELLVPGPAGRRVTQTSRLIVPPDGQVVDQLLDIPRQARPGVWNVRIVTDEQVVADRALYLVEP